jgi:hypothetical protein
MTKDIWSKTVWYVYLSPQGIRAKARKLTDGELRPGELLMYVVRGCSRKKVLQDAATAVRQAYAKRRAVKALERRTEAQQAAKQAAAV